MGLSTALETAVSGLNATQAQIGVISQNVSNQGSVGYTKRQTTLVQQVTDGQTTGVQVASVQRVLDAVVQAQLRTQTSAAAYTSAQNNGYKQLDQLFGQPGSANALDTTLNNFTTATQALANNPGNSINQSSFISSAQSLAQQLNTVSNGIQTQRDGIEANLSDDVQTVNGILANLQNLNSQIVALSASQRSPALEDQRDAQIDQLSKYVDVSLSSTPNNGIKITTTGGLPLLDGTASRFTYNQHYNLNATSLYNGSTVANSVGVITLVNANGTGTNVIANGSIRSGEIAGLLNVRDTQLVQAQAQVDELAAGLSNAVANNTVTGTAVVGGFNADFVNNPVQQGNEITIKYTSGGATKSITIKRVDDSTVTPPNTLNAQLLAQKNESTTNNQVIAVNFAGGYAAAIVAINGSGLLPAGLTITNPAGSQIQAVGAGAVAVTGVSGSITTTALTQQGTGFPLFVDNQTGSAYTGSFEGSSDQTVGLSQRLVVNPAVISNPTTLSVFQATSLSVATKIGDPTRPQYIYDQLTSANQAFSPLGGIGSNGAPFDGTVANFATNVVQNLSGRTINAANVDAGQQTVLKNVQSTYSSTSGVKIDEELSNLVAVQNAYSANARIISTVQALFEILQKI